MSLTNRFKFGAALDSPKKGEENSPITTSYQNKIINEKRAKTVVAFQSASSYDDKQKRIKFVRCSKTKRAACEDIVKEFTLGLAPSYFHYPSSAHHEQQGEATREK